MSLLSKETHSKDIFQDMQTVTLLPCARILTFLTKCFCQLRTIFLVNWEHFFFERPWDFFCFSQHLETMLLTFWWITSDDILWSNITLFPTNEQSLWCVLLSDVTMIPNRATKSLCYASRHDNERAFLILFLVLNDDSVQSKHFALPWCNSGQCFQTK